MVRLSLSSIVLALALAACGSDNGTKAPDAPSGDSQGASTVVSVSCTGITPAATVTPNSSGDGYMPPTTTIMQGQVVLFMTTSTHDVSPGHHTPDSTITDPGIHVDFNKTECRMFTQTGDYGFHCSFHNFDGTITVQ